MGEKYCFFEDSKEITEEYIRKLDYEENINDLINNREDIRLGLINIQSVCDNIVTALNGDIEEVVKDLNKCWGYDIQAYKKII